MVGFSLKEANEVRYLAGQGSGETIFKLLLLLKAKVKNVLCSFKSSFGSLRDNLQELINS